MKLYFLTGLLTETDEDTLGIVDLAANCVKTGKRYTNRASVTVSLAVSTQGAHTVPVVRLFRTPTRSCAARSVWPRTLPRRPRVQVKWARRRGQHGRGHHEPR
ncbi:MAG: hypothetical protein R2697_07025 [Ilumatobacteraceae bacterium]